MKIQVDPTVARDILQVARELRELVTQAPYAAGRVLAAAERLDLLAGATPPAPRKRAA